MCSIFMVSNNQITITYNIHPNQNFKVAFNIFTLRNFPGWRYKTIWEFYIYEKHIRPFTRYESA